MEKEPRKRLEGQKTSLESRPAGMFTLGLGNASNPSLGEKGTPSCKVQEHSLEEGGRFLCLEEETVALDVQT